MNDKPPTTAIPEASVAHILARAAELDRIAPTVQPDVIRAAAMEAGISAAAIERALEEFAAEPVIVHPVAAATNSEPAPQPRWKRWLSKLTHPVALFIGSFTLGGISTDAEPFILFGFAFLIMMGVRTAWRARSITAIGHYAAVVLAIAWGFGLGMAAGNGDEDAIAVLVVTAFIMMLAGPLLIYIRNYRKLAESQPV